MITTSLLLALAGSSPLAATSTPSFVSAPEPTEPAVNYDARPGILYLNFEGVTLVPYPCGTQENFNSALNCTGAVSEDTEVPALSDDTLKTDITSALETALAPYDIRVVTERPDDYIPYHMIVPTEIVNEESESETCLASALTCDGAKRNGIALLLSETMNCTGPDAVIQALYAAGVLSGLEGIENTDDPMNFPPDFTADPATSFADSCSALAAESPACGYIHKTYCEDTDGQQNAHQELLGVYGERAEDTTAPTIDAIEPGDGESFTDPESIPVKLTVGDDSNTVGVKVTLEAPGDTTITKCTNRTCDQWWDNLPPVGESFSVINLNQPPAGEYALTVEVQDIYGNTAMDSASFTVERTGGGDGDGDGSTGDGGGDGGGDDGATGDTGTDTGDGGGAGDGDGDDGGGCNVAGTPTAPLSAAGLLGLLALGWRRRRA